MKKFEYQISYLRSDADHFKIMNELGSEGWELIQVIPSGLDVNIIWKRSLPATEEEGEEKQ